MRAVSRGESVKAEMVSAGFVEGACGRCFLWRLSSAAQSGDLRSGRMELNQAAATRESREVSRAFGRGARALQAMDGKAAPDAGKYNSAEHWWGMTIDIAKCIGCGNCVRACSQENGVPHGYFRTWVERYSVHDEHAAPPQVDSPNGGMDGFPILNDAQGARASSCRSYATIAPIHRACRRVRWERHSYRRTAWCWWIEKYCIGCRYCIQACPYGCRYLDPRKNVVRQVFSMLSPHHERTDDGVLRSLSDGRPQAGGFQGSE